MSFSQTRLLHGQTRYNLKSRFIDELPEQDLKWLTAEGRQGPATTRPTARAMGAARPTAAMARRPLRRRARRQALPRGRSPPAPPATPAPAPGVRASSIASRSVPRDARSGSARGLRTPVSARAWLPASRVRRGCQGAGEVCRAWFKVAGAVDRQAGAGMKVPSALRQPAAGGRGVRQADQSAGTDRVRPHSQGPAKPIRGGG